MQVLDSSSALHAWDNYPIEQFPPLWAWLAQRVALSELSISGVALEEVRHKSPECATWLKTQQIRVLPMTQTILMDALRIKALLQIEEELYGSGVGENDLFIIATARARRGVTDRRSSAARPAQAAAQIQDSGRVCAARCPSVLPQLRGVFQALTGGLRLMRNA